MSDPVFRMYACCPSCKGVVAVWAVASAGAAAERGMMVTAAGCRPYVTGPGAQTAYSAGYRLSASCRQSHVCEVP